MTCTLKIRPSPDPATGAMRVPPVVMDLLMRFAGHRDLCDECGRKFATGAGDYCSTGRSLMLELLDQPEVEVTINP